MFDFLQYLNVVDREALEGARRRDEANGTGPFTFVEWVQGDHFTLARNTNYWDSGRPYLDGITIRFFRDPQTQIASPRGRRDRRRSPAAAARGRPSQGRLPISGARHFDCRPVLPHDGQCDAGADQQQAVPPGARLRRRPQALHRQHPSGLVGARRICRGRRSRPPPSQRRTSVYTYDLDKARSLIAQSGVTDTEHGHHVRLGGLQQEYAQLAQVSRPTWPRSA